MVRHLIIAFNPLERRLESAHNCYPMTRAAARRENALALKYPPSEPCCCETCRKYCARPGWWSVHQAGVAIAAGQGRRMMLEVSPEKDLGVLSPAFKGCEGGFALQRYAGNGCTFLAHGLCELHGSGLQPLECGFCHHERTGLGSLCHADLENDWRSPEGRALVGRWARLHGLSSALKRYGLQRLARL